MTQIIDPNQLSGLTKVSVCKSKTKSGKVKKFALFRLSAEVARKAKLRKGQAFSVFITQDGVITLVPMDQPSSNMSEERRAEILAALEETNRRFGSALRPLAE